MVLLFFLSFLGEPLENNEDQDIKPKVCCASRNRWLVIAAGCDINVFYLAVGVEHKWSISFKGLNFKIFVIVIILYFYRNR